MFRDSPKSSRIVPPAAALAIVGFLVPLIADITPGGSASSQDSQSQQVFVTVCERCHPVERITAMRRKRSQWEETITSMITARGAQISDGDFDTILTYLTREYGRVDINRAPAEDIVEVLAITDEMAGAILAYRKQHGPFDDFEALLKVPEIDRSALEKKRDAISF
jgi:competence ComEA-like helix-hairpin-helix protein